MATDTCHESAELGTRGTVMWSPRLAAMRSGTRATPRLWLTRARRVWTSLTSMVTGWATPHGGEGVVGDGAGAPGRVEVDEGLPRQVLQGDLGRVGQAVFGGTDHDHGLGRQRAEVQALDRVTGGCHEGDVQAPRGQFVEHGG